VVSKSPDEAKCKVLTAGIIRSRQGIHLPGVTLSVSAMRPEDIENAKWAANKEIDFISLSFVRSPQDVSSLKDLLASLESTAFVIAKIEKREALERLDEIVEVSDGIMVARGDLGVEIDVAETPVAQKRIIRVCQEKMKPVIVATQMLESMHNNRRPTRAEASDVANAILDGADACMLSGETAIGKFPIEAVAMMDRIMTHTETLLKGQPQPSRVKKFDPVNPITSAVTYNAASIAEAIDAKLVVVVSRSGNTAWINSKQRNYVLTLGISDNQAALRRMCLFWGIVPYYFENLDSPQKLFEEVTRWGHERGRLKAGDRVVFVTGTGVFDNAHNLLVVHEVES
jgi:pyruvate kinase